MSDLLLVTAGTTPPNANDDAIQGILTGEGFDVEVVAATDLTTEKLSLNFGKPVIITHDAVSLPTGIGAALKAHPTLIGRTGDVDLVTSSGLATAPNTSVNDYRFQKANFTKADISNTTNENGNDVTVYASQTDQYMLKESALGTGFVTVATDKDNTTRKLVGFYPEDAALADSDTSHAPLGYFGSQDFLNSTDAYKATVLDVFAQLRA